MTDATTPAAPQTPTEGAPATPAAAPAPGTTQATTDTLLTSEPATTPSPADDATAKAAAEAKAKADADAAAKANGAPETYEAFKFPDGANPADADVQQFSALARELNLSQANAQKLVDYQAGLLQRVEAEGAAANAAILKGWRDAVQADKEIGGSPEKVAENVALAKTALTRFGTPELTEFLKGGLGNHPEIIRAFAKVGKAIAEDGHVPGTSGGGGQRAVSLADRMYPNKS